MNTQHFDPTVILQDMRNKRSVKRRKKYQRSRLEKYRAEIVALRKAGGSYREIMQWLRSKQHLKITHTSIRDFIQQLLKLKEQQNAELS